MSKDYAEATSQPKVGPGDGKASGSSPSADTPQGGPQAASSWVKKNPATAVIVSCAVVGVVIGVVTLIGLVHPTVAMAVGGAIVALIGYAINCVWDRSHRLWFGLAIGSALVAVGAGVSVWAIAPTKQAAVIYRPGPVVTARPATITIDNPDPGARIAEYPSISGSVANLTAHEYIWVFNQHFMNRASGPNGQIYPVKPCAVVSDRSRFTCSAVWTGSLRSDYCGWDLLWVTVVSRSENSALNSSVKKARSNGRLAVLKIGWPGQPTHTGHGYDSVLVQRNPSRQQSSCPS